MDQLVKWLRNKNTKMKSFLYIEQKQIMTDPFNFVINKKKHKVISLFNFVINKKKHKVISLLIRKNDPLVLVICGRVWGGVRVKFLLNGSITVVKQKG